MRQTRLRRCKDQRDLPRDDVSERGSAASIWNVRHPDARAVEKDLGREMHDGTLSTAAERDPAWIRSRERDELAYVSGRKRGMHDDDVREFREQADGCEIGKRIELQGINAWIDGVARRNQGQRIPIRRRTYGVLVAYRAPCAGTIVDDD